MEFTEKIELDKEKEKEKAKKKEEDLFDEVGKGSFPASDPPSWNSGKRKK